MDVGLVLFSIILLIHIHLYGSFFFFLLAEGIASDCLAVLFKVKI